MHKTNASFDGLFGITFCTKFQRILNNTFKAEAALTEELSTEENYCLHEVCMVCW